MNGRCISFLTLTTLILPCTAAESLTVMEFVAQKDKWAEWSRKKTILNISGRYEGRVARQFRLEQFPALITPTRTTSLPSDIRGGQRLTITGTMQRVGTRIGFEATRIASGATDLARMDARLNRIDRKKPDQLYKLADEYQPIAEFYKDEDLTIRIRQLRTEAFDLERAQNRNDPAGLLRLAEQAAKNGVSDRIVNAIRFEALACRRGSTGKERTALLKEIQTQLKGWDRRNPFPSLADERAFLKDMISEYEAADELNRQRMHRRFYRVIRLAELLDTVQPDGSNGRAVAVKIEAELPEERQEIQRLNTLYVDYRLKQVPQLTRSKLEEVDRLLQQAGRSNEFDATLDTWLKAQEQRLNNGELVGMLLMADEYLFAYERWKKQRHKVSGIELLKGAWVLAEKAAPKEAASIAERLKRLGWERMHDRWMTTQEVENLPRDDVELAMKEGRVVAGMKHAQIIATLGKPSRRIRIISSRIVQEIWIYGEVGSTAITVHMERARLDNPEEAMATLVTRPAR